MSTSPYDASSVPGFRAGKKNSEKKKLKKSWRKVNDNMFRKGDFVLQRGAPGEKWRLTFTLPFEFTASTQAPTRVADMNIAAIGHAADEVL